MSLKNRSCQFSTPLKRLKTRNSTDFNGIVVVPGQLNATNGAAQFTVGYEALSYCASEWVDQVYFRSNPDGIKHF